MSEEILTLLRDKAAFKPKPPDYELPHAHVPLGDVGLPDPIEDRVIAAMRSEDESSVLIVAPPGCGKSSLLAWRRDDSALRRRYHRGCEVAGLRRVKLHGLRHAAGSILAREADPVFVRDYLGHSKLSTTTATSAPSIGRRTSSG